MDPINLENIQSNILSKSYGKSVPKNNTLDILKFKIYQQELEKKKKDKFAYSSMPNQYDSTLSLTHSSRSLDNENLRHDSKYNSFDHIINIDDSQSCIQDPSHSYININTNKPPLYTSSMMSSSSSVAPTGNNKKIINHTGSNKSRANNSMRASLSLTKDSQLIDSQNIDNENYNTHVNPNEDNHINSSGDKDQFVNSENDESEEVNGNELSFSPSAILTSPKMFKDMSSLSIIVPKNLDDSMVLDVKHEQNLIDQIPQTIPNTNAQNYNEVINYPLENNIITSPSIKNGNDHDNNPNNNITINTNNSFINNSNLFTDINHDLSINNNIIEPNEETSDDEDYSQCSSRRLSSEYSNNKRSSKPSTSSSFINKNTNGSSSLFTSSLPPLSRPTRVQSLPKVNPNSTNSNLPEKKTMAKAEDYIALSQRSFPARANFIPDIYYDDEIKLNTGDLVVITDVYLDEWARGINIMTNSSGVFPLCYLNTDEPQAQAKTKRFTRIVNQEINNT